MLAHNEIDFSRRFNNLQLPSSVITDEGNWRLPKRLEKSISFQPPVAFIGNY